MEDVSMREGTFGIKDLYEASLKAAVPMDINGVHYDVGDTILLLNHADAMAMQEVKSSSSAEGGYGNRPLVRWETTNYVDCAIRMGTVDFVSLGILNGTKAKKSIEKTINKFEILYVGQTKTKDLKYAPNMNKPIKVYEVEDGVAGRKILDFTIEGNTIILEEQCIDILVDYYFDYTSEMDVINIGQKDLNGYLMFVGKYYYTDEYTAVKKTGIIEIPKLIIDSNFNIQLGRTTNPLISVLQFQAVPVGPRGQAKAIVITHLDEDIDGDF